MIREAIDRALAAEGLDLTRGERQRLGRRIHMESSQLDEAMTKRTINTWIGIAEGNNDPVMTINLALASYPVPHDLAKAIQHLVCMVQNGGERPRTVGGERVDG